MTSRLAELGGEGYTINLNLLGEMVLGEGEAERRLNAVIDLIERPDVSYVSVKASALASQLNLWGHDESVDRVVARLRPVFDAAARQRPTTFVNLDMEEYKDLRLTLDVFERLLDEPAFESLEAGIALQAYLPDSGAALDELTTWAGARVARGGAPIKVRIVKGANLAMERVDAAMHGWAQAPYATKADVDANYKRMVDTAFDAERLRSVRIGVASHNLFDVAWALLLARARGVEERVVIEMLQGMAPALARVVRQEADHLLLYTPVVAPDDFDTALAYLFRRLEENSSGDNFLRHVFELRDRPAVFDAERARFARAVSERWTVESRPRRHRHEPVVADASGRRGPAAFENVADSDPTDEPVRSQILAAVDAWRPATLPPPATEVTIDAAVTAATVAGQRWRSTAPDERRRILLDVGDELSRRRAQLIAVMAGEAAKTLNEGDVEVSEAIDFARYYALHLPEHVGPPGAAFEPLGVIAVVPPWNFPLAIPLGGVLAALAAGNAVIIKPAPQTPQVALAGIEACWAAGVPRDVLQYVQCDDGPAAERLIAHHGIGGIVLTGSMETGELFRRIAPATPLFAETSGKNAIVVMPDADLDLAVSDLVRSAFGHSGQKCSAASLAICVGDVARSERFRRQLADATRSLAIGLPQQPASTVGPLVEAPTGKLLRALTTLEPGERWLVEPRCIDASHHLWSPGIIDGVAPGSWFHRTECFGPVLGLMAARDLDEAIELQNGTPFGLTGGIATLDPSNVDRWLERVEVGNAYVNRAITGAIVQRQPFGGWNGSVVGPGAKAGGPNYVAQLGTWRDAVGSGDEAANADLTDADWCALHVAHEHDPSGLFCESNVFRYRPLREVPLRVGGDATCADVTRVLAAIAAVGSTVALSVALDWSEALDAPHRRERAEAFWARIANDPPPRVRLLGEEVPWSTVLPVTTFVDDRPVVRCGRIELVRYVREQSVTTTLHRFGNLVGNISGSAVVE